MIVAVGTSTLTEIGKWAAIVGSIGAVIALIISSSALRWQILSQYVIRQPIFTLRSQTMSTESLL